MKKRLTAFLALVLVCIMPLLLTGCKISIQEDSDVYTCTSYIVDGEERIGDFHYYYIELRKNLKMMTYYKTSKNKEAGRNDYRIDGEKLIVEENVGTSEYIIRDGQLIMNNSVSGKDVRAHFVRVENHEDIRFD